MAFQASKRLAADSHLNFLAMTTPQRPCLVAIMEAMSSLIATRAKITTMIATSRDKERHLAVIK